MKYLLSPAAFLALIASALPAYAQSAYEGLAKPWQLGFQEGATPVMQQLTQMHDFLLIIITSITLLVMFVMAYICVRFSRRNNPVASKTAHNTRLEIIWTVIPILILVVIAVPSLRLHYFMHNDVDPDITLKVVGYQWYWHYEYPDQGGFGYDSYIKKDHLEPNEHRMLAVDNHVVVPVDAKVRVLITGADVIHSWAVPAFGVKRDAVPGRLNESWFKATKIGTFYGQCSQLCGVGHGFMPIVVDVVSKDDFDSWVKKKQQEAGIAQPIATPQNADKAQGLKTATPITEPQSSAAHKNPTSVIDAEKKASKPGASDSKNLPNSASDHTKAPAPGDEPAVAPAKPDSDTDNE